MKLLLPILILCAAATRAEIPPILPAFQGGGQLRGIAEPIAPPPYDVRWKVKLGDEDKRTSVDNNPTIAGDTAYVADSEGVLHALPLADGKERWAYKTDSGFATSPLVLGNRIYAGDLD